MTLKFDLFGSQNDFEMTFNVKIFSGFDRSNVFSDAIGQFQ